MEKIYDFLGNEINIGAYVVYGYSSLGNYGLKYGKILNMKVKKSRNKRDTVVKMTVQSLKLTEAGHFVLSNHLATLGSPDRLIVVTNINSPKKEIYG